METLLTILLALLGGLAAFIYKQNKTINKLDTDLKTKEYAVKFAEEKRRLAISKAAIEGAKHGAEEAVKNLREHLRSKHGIVFDPNDGSIKTEKKSDKD